ncbi:MAG TPA: DUF4136 domain-containing protein [Candidatus Acidoferrum sp.]|jgi:hypothetical protein
MWYPTLVKTRKPALLLAALVASGLIFAGCDEHVDVVRDRSVAIPRNATWAWRPEAPPPKAPERNQDTDSGRKVISRDVMPGNERREARENENRVDNETLRLAIRTDIEQTLASKGLKQVNDPRTAEFLVDYHFGIHSRTVAVQRGYPGFVCGPFGCWANYRWGYWGGPGWGYENIHYREGTIVLDFVKQNSNKIAFRAVGHRQLTNESFSTDHVRDAVHRLLRDLKPSK